VPIRLPKVCPRPCKLGHVLRTTTCIHDFDGKENPKPYCITRSVKDKNDGRPLEILGASRAPSPSVISSLYKDPAVLEASVLCCSCHIRFRSIPQMTRLHAGSVEIRGNCGLSAVDGGSGDLYLLGNFVREIEAR
jgi:hypothetical protein